MGDDRTTADPSAGGDQGKTVTTGGGAAQPVTRASPSDRYEVRGELGRGGVGVVLAALDRETHRIVALKVPAR